MAILNKRVWDVIAQNKIHSLLILILLTYWVPILRFGFDPHHDGLIIASVTNLKFSDTDVPFNQYGPAWFIILKLIAGLTPNSYLFLTLRVVTLFFYLCSFLATYLLSRKFMSRRYSLGVVIVLLAIQPFVTDFNSDMIPWPSALSMFFIPTIGLLIVDENERISPRFIYFKSALAGSLVVLTTLTRIQIGFALTFTILLLLCIYKRWTNLIFFSVGLISSLVTSCALLAKLGWLQSLINDVIGFGSTYVFGDRATFPKPFWTLLLTLSFLFAYIGLQLFGLLKYRFFKFACAISLVAVLILGSYIILTERQLNLVQTLTVLFRRIWIAGLLAAAILGLLMLTNKILRTRKLPDFNVSTLVATSIVAQLQIWPLFDQMHAWWAATPCVVLAAVLLKSLKPLTTMSQKSKSVYEHLLLAIVSAIAFTTFMSTMSHTRVPLHINGFSGILISEVEGIELSAVNQYLQSQIHPGEEVLNLCTNADVFFDPEFAPKSASRAFVFWTPMIDLLQLREDILNSNPGKILTCSFVTNPLFYPEYEIRQDEILANFGLLSEVPNSFISPNGITWEVYSRDTQA